MSRTVVDGGIPDSSTTVKLIDFPRLPTMGWSGLGWYSSSESESVVRNSDSSKAFGNDPFRCANPNPINGMRGVFVALAAYVKPLPTRQIAITASAVPRKRFANERPGGRAQTLRCASKGSFYEFSLRAVLTAVSRLTRYQPYLARYGWIGQIGFVHEDTPAM